MRTSLDALVTAYTGICIFENRMFVPQKTDFSDNMFRTLLYTLPTSHASMWIHGYILSRYSFHIYLLFCLQSYVVLEKKGIERTRQGLDYSRFLSRNRVGLMPACCVNRREK